MTKTILQNFTLTVLLLSSSLFFNSLKAEDVSANCLITFDIADHVVAATGETVCVPVTVMNFTEVAGFQFNLGWDVNQLSFTEVIGVGVPMNASTNYNEVSPGNLIVVSLVSSANGQTLADNSVAFELCFEVVGTAVETAPITFLSDYTIEVAVIAELVSGTMIGGSVEIGNTGPTMPLSISEDCGLACTDIDVVITGGQAPYSYLWTGPNNYTSTTEDLSGVAEGNYELIVTDSNGESQAVSFYITNASGLDLTYNTTDAGCANPNGGTIDITLNNGIAPFTYQWSNGATTEDISDLTSGTYVLTVTDNEGCQRIETIQVGGAPAISLFSFVTDIDCPDGSNGDIYASAAGGQFPYTYEWSNGAIGNTISNLTAGTYEVTITDDNNCTITETFTVVELNLQDELSANIDNAYCGTNDGRIYLSVPGSISNYDYLWSNGTTGNNANNLAPGDYSVTVTAIDGGCQAVGTYTVLDEGIALDFDYSCNNGLVDLTAFVSNGQEDYTFEFSDGTTLTDSSYAEVMGLPTGDYSITVTGQTTGCLATIGPLNADCTVGPTSDCFAVIAGSANANAGSQICIPITTQGFKEIVGIQFSVSWDPTVLGYINTESYGLPGLFSSNFGTLSSDQGKLAFLWSTPDPSTVGLTLPDGNTLFDICFDVVGSNGTTSSIDLTEDLIIFEVFGGDGAQGLDFIGFTGASGQVNVGGSTDPLVISNVCGTGSCSGTEGTAEVTIVGGIPPFAYAWTDGAGNVIGTTMNLIDLPAGDYEVEVTDSNGNTVYSSVEILLEDCVWPGDTDDSGLVDNFDILNIGLGAGTGGSLRSNASINWFGQSASSWFETTPNSMVNYKHIDTDGNGLIADADTLAIVQNWGEIHNFTGDIDQQFIDLPSSGDHFVTLPFYVQSDTIEPNTIVALPVILGEMDNAVTDLYGLAFTITFDPEVIVPGSAYLNFDDSWLGDINNNTIAIQKTFHADGRLDIGMTRTDGNNMDGFGKIADFFITIEDDIFFGQDEDSRGVLITDTDFGIENVRLITNLEEEILTSPTTTTTVIETIGTGTEDWLGASAISLYPNPVSDLLQIKSPMASIESIRLYDVAGSLIQVITYPGQEEVVLNTNALEGGTFLVEIQTANGQAVRRIVVMK